MDRTAVTLFLLAGLAGILSGCSKTSTATKATVESVAPSSPKADPNQTASQRLRAVAWVYSGKDGSTQKLKFGDGDKVIISEFNIKRGNFTRSLLYRIVDEEGRRLTMHFADDGGASVSGIQALVGDRLEFPTGGAFGINGVYDPQ
jgi:hypothetical protein